jgi:hypothetical protein
MTDDVANAAANEAGQASHAVDATPTNVADGQQPGGQVSEPSNADGNTAPDAGQDQEGQEPEWFKKRIDRFTRNQREVERDRDYWRDMAMRGQQPPQTQQQAPAGPAPLPPQIAAQIGPEPQPGSYPAGEFDPKYLRDVAAYDRKVEAAQGWVRQQGEAQRRQQQQVAETWTKKVEAASGRYSDFHDVATRSDLPITPVMAEAIADSDIGPDVAYYLGKNPAEAARIAALSPAKQAREIGRLEARVDADLKAASRQQSSAPPPPSTLKGGSGNASNLKPWDLPMDQFAARERKRRGA